MKKIILLLTFWLTASVSLFGQADTIKTNNPTTPRVITRNLIADSLHASRYGSGVKSDTLKLDSALGFLFGDGSYLNSGNLTPDTLVVATKAYVNHKVDSVGALTNVIIYVTGNEASDIQDAIDAATVPATIVLARDVTYLQTDALEMTDGITLDGNGATIKRGAAQFTTLADSANSTYGFLIVDSIPTGWKAGDQLQLYGDSTIQTSTFNGGGMLISSISNDTIYLTGLVGPEAFTSTNYNWVAGSYVRKIYSQIGSSLVTTPRWVVKNIIFDGNHAENNQNYYWGVNACLVGNGKITIDNCQFLRMPNENIVGSGMTITNCYAKELYGSFFHIAANLSIMDKKLFGSYVSGNATDSTNLIPYAVSGHNEAVITFSVGGGFATIVGNNFKDQAQSVIGWLHSGGTNTDDAGTREFIFSNNVVVNDPDFTNIGTFQQIVCCMAHSAGSVDSNRAGGISIQNNVFDNCGANDWSTFATAIDSFDGVKMCNNVLTGGTTLSNVPQRALCDSLQAALTYQRTAVLFASPTDGYIRDDSLRLNYDSTNRRFGIGTAATANLHLRSNSASSGNMVLFENSTPSAAYTITNTRQHTMSSALGAFVLNTTGTGPIFDYDINSSGSITNFIRFGFGTISSATTGTITAVRFNGGFSASSGTAVFNNILLDFTINQTGTATGITRGIYINPSITGAVDFRAAQIDKGKIFFPIGSGAGSGGSPWIPQSYSFNDSIGVVDAITGQVKFKPQSYFVLNTDTVASGNITMGTVTHYSFSGTTATWTLPTVAAGNGHTYYIKNRGSGTLTINTAAAGNDIYDAAAVNTFDLLAGQFLVIHNDGTYFNLGGY